MDDPFILSNYIFCKYAGAVGVLNMEGDVILYAEREGISKIGKDAYVYTSKHKTNKVLVIRAPKAIEELNPTFTDREYVVEDLRTEEAVGKIYQKKLVRIVNDEWLFLPADGSSVIGRVKETDIFRHFFHGLLFPRKYYIESSSGEIVGTIEELRSLANLKFAMDIEKLGVIDNRLLVSFGILLAMLKVQL